MSDESPTPEKDAENSTESTVVSTTEKKVDAATKPTSVTAQKQSKLFAWMVLSIAGITCASTFYIQKKDLTTKLTAIKDVVALEKDASIKALQEKDAFIAQERAVLKEQLKQATEELKAEQESTSSELGSDISQKSGQISKLRKSIKNLKQENQEDRKLWQYSMMTSLDITQEVYAMKWQTNNSVLSDMENQSARTLDVAQKWEELITKLDPITEAAPLVAKLRIRVAQAYSGLGLVQKIDLTNVDWKAAGLEEQKPEIQASLWFSLATNYSKSGKLKEAKEYLAKAKETIPEMTTTPDKATYYSAMMNLLEGEITASKNPSESLKFYNKAADDLSKIVTSVPSNTKLRTKFIQACLDGALLSEGGSSVGQATALRKRAFASINSLLEENPKIKKPNLLYAEVKLLEAESKLREGEQFKASEILTVVRDHIKKGGGSVLLTAEADSSQAFIHWEHGERTKAMEIIDSAIAKVDKFQLDSPKSKEADYRLASLYWVRSSMQITPAASIADGQKSAQYLIKLITQGAGKREASARRIVAIIYGDIGQQAATSGQKDVAKQYFAEAMKQWSALTKNWGGSDEYAEGERWCQWNISNLK